MTELEKYLGKDAAENVVGTIKDMREVQYKGNVLGAIDTNPDEFAEAAEIGKRRDLPQAAVMDALPEMRKKERVGDIDKIVSDSPILKEWLTSDPSNAKVAHDDLQNLGFFAKTIEEIKQSKFVAKDVLVRSPAEEFIKTPGTMLKGIGDVNDALAALITSGIRAVGLEGAAEFLEKPRAIPWWVNPSEIFRQPGKQLIRAGEAVGVAPEEKTLYTDISGAVGQIGAQALIYALNPTAGVVGLYGQGASSGADEAESSGASRFDKATSTLAYGAITTATEKFGLDMLLNRVPPEIKNQVVRALVDKVIAAGVEASEEIVEGYFHNVVAALTFDPERKLTEGLGREALAAGGGAALVRTLIGGGRGVSELYTKHRQVQQAKQNQDLIAALGDNATSSKVLARLPEKYKEFVRNVKAAGPVENIYIPADKFTAYFQDAGLDPVEEARKISPALADSISEAMALGEDVAIPLEDFQAHIAPTEHLAGLAKDMRFHHDEMTAREAEAYESENMKELEDFFKSVSDEGVVSQKKADLFDTIKQGMKEQFLRAGQADRVSDRLASLYAARVVTRAERLGVSPDELMRERDVIVRGEVLERLREKPVEEIDLFIDRLKAGRIPTQKDIGGVGLIDFLRSRGGVVDERGEISAREIKSRPGQRRLIQAEGMSLDDAALAAWEEGYFPGQERPTINELLDAIDREVGGEIVSSRFNEQAATEKRDLEELKRVIEEAGLDLETATNEEIKAAIGEATPVGPAIGGEEFGQFAGRGSMRVNHEALASAIKMEKEGKGSATILRETGWHRGVDMKWRYEISDDAAKFSTPFKNLALDTPLTLGEIISHDRLFDAYPDLSDMQVTLSTTIEDINGQYVRESDSILLAAGRSESVTMDTLLHEIQHAIQEREGFALGGSGEMNFVVAVKSALKGLSDETARAVNDWKADNFEKIEDAERASRVARYGLMYDSAQRLIEYSRRDKPSGVLRLIRREIQWIYDQDFRGDSVANELSGRFYSIPKRHRASARNSYLSDLAFDAAQWIKDQIPDGLLEQFKEDPRTMRGMLNALDREASKARKALAGLRKAEAERKSAEYVLEKSQFKGPHEIYLALAGEIEARNTVARRGMTEEERAARRPWETADIQADEAIVVMGGMEIQAPITMLSSGGVAGGQVNTETEAFKEWFGDSKVVDENGDPLVVYHGTTHDIEAFSPERGDVENDFGLGFYFSSSSEDVAANYAGEGPDLTNRIVQRAERLEQEIEDIIDEGGIDAVIERYGEDVLPTDSADAVAIAERVARKELVGQTPNTIATYISIQNPVVIGGENETFFDSEEIVNSEDYIDQAREEIIEENTEDGELLVDESEIESLSEDRARDLAIEAGDVSEPEGAIPSILEALRNLSYEFDGMDIDQIVSDMDQYILEGGRASEVVSSLKSSEGLNYATDENGNLASGEIIRRAFEAAGFDGIIDNTVYDKFGPKGTKMKGVLPDTQHVIAFKPTQVKSVFNRGTFDPRDPRILYQADLVDQRKKDLQETQRDDIFNIEETKRRAQNGIYIHDRVPVEARRRAAGSSIVDAQAIAARSLRSVSDENAGGFPVSRSINGRYFEAKAIRAAESEFLRRWAGQNGLIIPDFEQRHKQASDEFNNGESLGGNENFVFYDADRNVWLKANRFKYTPTFHDLFDRVMLHNLMFPETAYTLEGFADVGGEFLPVFSQPNYQQDKNVSEADIVRLGEEKMRSLGFEKVVLEQYGGQPRWVKGDIIVHDIDAKNISVVNGEPYIFDPVVYLNTATKAERVTGEAIDVSTAEVVGEDEDLDSIALQLGVELFQPEDVVGGAMKRGSILLAEDQAVITLLKDANLSTALHEFGHLFIDDLAADAMKAGAPQQIKDDFKTLLDFVGAKSADELNPNLYGDAAREKVETLARGFEAYLRDGKAPSVELQSAFQTFKAWLIRIYRAILDLDVEINDDVRKVFDRMLATDEEISAAEEFHRFAPVFSTAEAGGLTAEEFANLQSAAQKATKAAEEDLLKETMKEVSREETKAWKEARDRIERQVTDEVNGQPVYQAFHYLATGEMLGVEMEAGHVPIRMSKQALVDTYGQEVIKRLPRGKQAIYTDEGGVDPDIIAEQFGFSCGDEMIKSFLRMQKREAVIKNEVALRVKKEFGDMMTDGQIEEKANDAIHRDERASFMWVQLKALSKKAGVDVTPKQVLKAAAQRIVAGRKIKDINLGRVSNAEVKASKDLLRAATSGDFNAAVSAQYTQLLQHYIYMESRAVRDEVTKGVKKFKDYDKTALREKLGKAGHDYLEKIDAILAQFEFRKSLKQLDRLRGVSAWAEAEREAGNFVDLPDGYLEGADRKHYREMTIDEFRAIQDAVENIKTVALNKNRLLTDREKRLLEEAVTEITDSIQKNWRGKRKPPSISRTDFDKRKDTFVKAFSLRKFESWARQLDGFKPDGAFHRYIYLTMAKATDSYEIMTNDFASAFRDIFEGFTTKEFRRATNKQEFFEEIGEKMTRSSLWLVALNYGNKEGRERLTTGFGWTEPQIEQLLSRLTPKEWGAIDKTWKYLESRWPETEALEKRTKGIAPKRVEAIPVKTPIGTLGGGYFPIKYSRTLSDRAVIHEAEELYKGLKGGMIGRPRTNKGRTISRLETVGENLKLNLDLDVFLQHVKESNHDLAYREALHDVSKLINHPRLSDAVRETAGPVRLDMMRDWLQDAVVGGAVSPIKASDIFFGHVRRKTTFMTMGWKLSTALVQPLGFTQSVARFVQDAGSVKGGVHYAIRGLTNFYGSPGKMREKYSFVLDKSKMMKSRLRNYDREVHDSIKELKKGRPLAAYEASLLEHIAKMQMLVDIPTWLGAYEMALDTFAAGDDAKAADHADSVVRLTQGSGLNVDLAPIQRGGEGQRIINMYQTFFNAMHNMIVDEVELTRRVGPRRTGQLIFNLLLLTFLPSVLLESIYAAAGVGGPDDDEGWSEWAAKQWGLFMLAPYPIIRDVASNVIGGFPYQISPIQGAMKEVTNLASQAKQGEIDKPLVRAAVKTVGLLPGVPPIPANQILLTGEYFTDYLSGTTDEFSLVEAFVRKNYNGGD